MRTSAMQTWAMQTSAIPGRRRPSRRSWRAGTLLGLSLFLSGSLTGCGDSPFEDRTTLGISLRQTWTAGGYTLQADTLSGELLARRPVEISVRYASGQAWSAGAVLSPGCRVEALRSGERLRFELARAVQLNAPPRACRTGE